MQRALNWILPIILLGSLSWFVLLLSRLNNELFSKETIPQIFATAPLIPLILAAFLINLNKRKLRFSLITLILSLALGTILNLTPALVATYWSTYLAISILCATSLLIASIGTEHSLSKFARLFLLVSGLSSAFILILECEYPESYTAGWIALLLAFVFTLLSGIKNLLTSRK